MKHFRGKSEFSVANHNCLEAVLVVYVIHENTSFHCCLLLFMAENSSMNLFCHWFHYEINLSNEIPFKGRLFPPTLFCYYFFFFSGAMHATRLFWLIPDTVRFQRASKPIFSAANEFTLLWLSEFEDFHSMYFITPVSWVKAFQRVWP